MRGTLSMDEIDMFEIIRIKKEYLKQHVNTFFVLKLLLEIDK